MTHSGRFRLPSVPAFALAALAALVAPVITTLPSGAAPAPRPVAPDTTEVALREVVAATTASPSVEAEAGPDAGTEAPREARSGAVDLDGELRVIGVTWSEAAPAQPGSVELREQVDGVWGPWTEMPADDEHGADPGTAEAQGARAGTDPYVTTADAVEVRVTGEDPEELPQARLDVIDPGESPADAPTSTAGTAGADGARPTIYTRAQWGADESMRRSTPSYGKVKAAVVHHTAGATDYTSSQVPSIIRGIYAYHVKSNGWNDIGYNFLIDRFGRTWEGRYGGVDKPVIGAHALGVNSQTYGAAVLGTFGSTEPPKAVLTAQAKLASWRLGLAGVSAGARTTLEGYGTFSTINGHRDTFNTSCPGAKLYAALGSIRSLATTYQGSMILGPSISRTSYGYGGNGIVLSGTVANPVSWTMTVRSPCRTTAQATISGRASSSSPVSATWNGKDSAGRFVPPGKYTVSLQVAAGSGTPSGSPVVSYTVTVGSAADAPASYCSPPRLAGADRYATAVAVSREADAQSTVAVITSGVEASMPDALVAAPLARAKGGVLLLSGPGGLTSATRSEITRRGVTSAYIVGGSSVVPEEVRSQLAELGVGSVVRIAGADRFATAAAVARALGGTQREAMIANGEDGSMADGLLLSGPASALGRPVLLVTRKGVPSATRNALVALGTRSTVIGGGTTVVPSGVAAALPSPTRLGGADRYATSTAIATWATSLISTSEVVLASGEREALVDALSGGQLGRATLMATQQTVPSSVRSWLTRSQGVESVDVLGGRSVVSDEAAAVALDALR